MEILERDYFLKQLHRGFENADAGQGHCVFVQGEAGIGKSTLIKQFLSEVRNKSVQYKGYCDALFAPIPLAPVHDVAIQAGLDLALLFTGDNAGASLFSTFPKLLLQEKQTVILVFEDIHWADEATFDFIKYFARRISRFRCLFVLSWRDDEISHLHPLHQALGDLEANSFFRLTLPSLSENAVGKLASDKGYDSRYLFEVSQGNPFFVQELLNNENQGLPRNVQDAVLLNYNRQSVQVRDAWRLLALMPEGLELTRISLFDAPFREAINGSLEKKILMVQNSKVFFKHELFRLSVLATVTAIDSLLLHKQVLSILMPVFREQQEWARIVHYARNADNRDLILECAPLAARHAAANGAHTQAVQLYLTAIEVSKFCKNEELLKLYDAYSYECYLTNQIREAITYAEKGLVLYEQAGDKQLIGKSLRFLSRLWWFNGNHFQTEKYGLAAVEMLDDQPDSSIKAMAYSNLSQLYMLQKKKRDCLFWGGKAIEMATRLEDEETLCHALNNMGAVQLRSMDSKEIGRKLLEKSLHIALFNGYHEHAARAYTNLISIFIAIRAYDLAAYYLNQGLAYCEERNLDSWTTYKLSWKARMLFETGKWNDASNICGRLQQNERQPPVVKISILVIQASILMRCGEPPAKEMLNTAKELAFATEEYQRVVPVMVALLEMEWLTGELIVNDKELDRVAVMLQQVDDIQLTHEYNFWLELANREPIDDNRPSQSQRFTPQHKEADSGYWKSIGCEYEAALILFRGDDGMKREALKIVQGLGASGTIRRMKQDMQLAGVKNIPRGKRESTKGNPAQLTTREIEILQLLQKAMSNKEIAEALYISAKTVDHHISSILSKLNAPSRSKAAAMAMSLGIIAKT